MAQKFVEARDATISLRSYPLDITLSEGGAEQYKFQVHLKDRTTFDNYLKAVLPELVNYGRLNETVWKYGRSAAIA